jgi:hypothetical protein
MIIIRSTSPIDRPSMQTIDAGNALSIGYKPSMPDVSMWWHSASLPALASG